MGAYDIKLFQTQSLYFHQGDHEPAERVKHYLEEAFDLLIDDVSVDVDYNTHPEPPVSVVHTTTDVWDDVCGQDFPYNWMQVWFEDYATCVLSSSQIANDVNILISDRDGGQSGATDWQDGTSYIFVEGGPDLPDNPTTFARRRKTFAHNQMQNVFHELGHALMGGDDGLTHNGHETGAITQTASDHFYTTPMGTNGSTDNICSSGPWTRPGDHEWDLLWSSCNMSYWNDPGNLGIGYD